jgi:hypothetical protein
VLAGIESSACTRPEEDAPIIYKEEAVQKSHIEQLVLVVAI